MAYSSSIAGALSPNSAAVYEKNQRWLQQREARSTQILSTLLQREVEGLQSSPRISTASVEIAARSERAKVDVVTRLFRDGEAIKATKEALAREIHAQEFVGVPAITRYAAEIKRSGPVADRLYAEAEALKKKKEDLVSTLLRQEKDAAAAPPKPTRRASISGPVAGVAGHTTEQLYRNAAELVKKREEEKARLDREAREQAKPALNAKSLEIAANMSREKLEKMYKKDVDGLVPVHERSVTEPKDGFYDLPSDATFHPKIAPRSARLAAKRYGSEAAVPVDERLYREAGKKEEKLRELARVRAEMEVQGCTFFPNTDPLKPGLNAAIQAGALDASHAGSAVSGPGSAGGSVTGPVSPRHALKASEAAAIFARQSNWLQERDKKVEEQRKEQENRELVGCTFAPEVGPTSRALARRSSLDGRTTGTDMLMALAGGAGGATRGRRASLPGRVAGTAGGSPSKGTSDSVVGLDKFMKRLEAGRRIKEERDNPSWVPKGDNWKGVPTQAVAPNLRTASIGASGYRGVPSASDVNSSHLGGADSVRSGGASVSLRRPASAAAGAGRGGERPGVTVHLRTPVGASSGGNKTGQQPGGRTPSMIREAQAGAAAAAGQAQAAAQGQARAAAEAQAQAQAQAIAQARARAQIAQLTAASVGQRAGSEASGPGAQLMAQVQAQQPAQQAVGGPAAGVAPRRTPEDIIQETIARSLGQLGMGSAAGALTGTGASASASAAAGASSGAGAQPSRPGAATDLATAEDIRNRMKMIQIMKNGMLAGGAGSGAGTAGAAGGASAAGAGSGAGAGQALPSRGGTQLRTTMMDTSGPGSAFMRVGGLGPSFGGAGGSAAEMIGRAEPPTVRFAQPLARPATADPILARVEMMAAAAAGRQ